MSCVFINTMASVPKKIKINITETREIDNISSACTSIINVPTEEEISDSDLPLLANVDQVKVLHYLMKLNFDIENRNIGGSLVLFLRPTVSAKPWETIVLDSCSIFVKNVYFLKRIDEFDSENALTSADNLIRKNFYKKHNIDWFSAEGFELKFTSKKWSLNITGWQTDTVDQCPSVIRIHYDVMPATPSLHWRPTTGFSYQEGRKCVYTPASPVNNRGLFPCQEPPSAMATWECIVTAAKDNVPLLASDEPGENIFEDENCQTNYFYSSMVLPMAVFAIVIGKFPIKIPDLLLPSMTNVGVDLSVNSLQYKCDHDMYPCRLQNKEFQSLPLIPVRFFSLVKGLNLDIPFLTKFVKAIMKSTFKILGPHPFSRLDLVVLPKYFPDLGLCNPHLIFLSPTLFIGNNDPLYLMRIPHEICHFWFGLLIGALDWSEEFLSEGFATFLEDCVYKEAIREVKNDTDVKVDIDMKACVRFATLQEEIKNTAAHPDLLILSANDASNPPSKSVKNGMFPMKKFMQVHYLKGYFFLKYLSSAVGEENFLTFLKECVLKFHGQLLTSDMFLHFFYDNFSQALSCQAEFNSMEVLKVSWLKSTQLPEPFNSCNVLNGTIHPKFKEMFPNCPESLSKIQVAFKALCSTGKLRGNSLKSLTTNQLDLLIRKVLHDWSELKGIKRIYDRLMKLSGIQPKFQNPEMSHLVCELILLKKDLTKKKVVKAFLENHQSLGVYIYGELMISEKREFQKLAKDLLWKMIDVLDPSQKKIIMEMVES